MVDVVTHFGSVVDDLGSKTLPAGGSFVFRGTVAIPHPDLWAPGHAYLYPVTFDASASPSGASET